MGGANRYRAALRRLAPWSRAADDISWLAAMAAHDTQWCSTCKKIKEIGLFTGRATCDSCRAKGKRNWKKKQSSLADVNKQTTDHTLYTENKRPRSVNADLVAHMANVQNSLQHQA